MYHSNRQVVGEEKEVIMLCSFSTLDDTHLKAIQALEKEIGKVLLSFSCHDIAPAIIDDDALSKISELEKKLGIVLVAVQ